VCFLLTKTYMDVGDPDCASVGEKSHLQSRQGF
jgi:hypothetical protein